MGRMRALSDPSHEPFRVNPSRLRVNGSRKSRKTVVPTGSGLTKNARRLSLTSQKTFSASGANARDDRPSEGFPD